MLRPLTLIVAIMAFTRAAVAAPAGPAGHAEVLREAVAEVGYFAFDRAYPLFVRVMKDADPGSPAWQQAVYGAAVSIQQMTPATAGNGREAQRLFALLLEKAPDSRFASRATLNLGRIAELRDFTTDTPNLEAARQRYAQVREKWPDDPIAGEAFLREAATYGQTFEKAQVERAITMLKEWMTKHPDEPLSAGMWLYIAELFFYPLGDHPQSLDAYRRAEGIGLPDPGRAGGIYWRMAVMADRLGQRAVAVECYTKVIQRAPTGGKAYQAQLALRRLGAPVPRLSLDEPAMPQEPAK